jgi:hypothetical protein
MIFILNFGRFFYFGPCPSNLSRGARRRLATAEALVVPPGVRCCALGRFFGFNHKIMIKVQESPPSIMVTRNLWFVRV